MDGAGIPGVTLQGLFDNPVSAANGYYDAPFWDGWSGTVTPHSDDYVFIPSSRSYSALGSDQIQQNFVGISIAGLPVMSAVATYAAGHIPTDFGFQTLPGQSASPGTLTVSIPSNATIVGVDVAYTMTAQNGGWMSDQCSWLRCISPGGVGESAMAHGVGNTEGTYSYHRTGLPIANGVTGGGEIVFELHAGRTWGGSGFDTHYNRVDNGSWTVTVQYIELAIEHHLTAIAISPEATADVVVQPGLPQWLYTLQYSTDLRNPDGWQDVDGQVDVPGEGLPLPLTGLESEGAIFYRVLIREAP